MFDPELIKAVQKPVLYASGTAQMWTDAHISKQLLAVHLNEDLDLASRRPGTIDHTVNWIQAQAGRSDLDILDLGCGPGLYARRLALAGHRVTGVDFSANSIDHARRDAERLGLGITYRQQDYLTLNDESAYDVVMMIYTDFGVLLPEDRETLIRAVHRALRPGGLFIFDVLNNQNIEAKVPPKSWEMAEEGFWRDSPYLLLSESFLYEEASVVLHQHVVAEPDGRHEIYRFWTHHFSDTAIEAVLEDTGFTKPRCYRDVLPPGDLFSGDHVTFAVTEKPTS